MITGYERNIMLSAINVSKIYRGEKKAAVNSVNFTLNEGEFCSLVGESGSGKSTLAQLMSGLIAATSGEIMYDNIRVSPKERRTSKKLCSEIQLVLQNSKAAVDPRFSVYNTIAEPIRNLRKCSRTEESEIITQLIRDIELDETILRQKASELSGGQQKRVCIARALAADPKIIIFDEAVSGLDMAVRKSILDLLKRVHSKTGKTFLLITHDIDAAIYTSSRIAVMRGGKILEDIYYSGDLGVFKKDYSKRLISSSLPQSVIDAYGVYIEQNKRRISI